MEVATKEMCMLEPDIGSLYSCRINEHKDFVSMRTPILIYIFKETEINPTQFPHQEAQKKIQWCNDPKTDLSWLFCLDRLGSNIRIQGCSAPLALSLITLRVYFERS